MNFNIIVCTDKKNGIGKEGKMPWHNIVDLEHFKKVTTSTPIPHMQNAVIMGRVTHESIGKPLPNRLNIIISSKTNPNILTFKTLYESLVYLKTQSINQVFVIGGEALYREAVRSPFFDKLYITKIDADYGCDRFFPEIKYNIIHKTLIHNMEFIYSQPVQNGEREYLLLLNKVLHANKLRATRSGNTISVFDNSSLTFNLNNEFPLLTSKKVPFRLIFEELLFFLRGDTNTKKLEEKQVNIWKGNTSKEFLESRNLNYLEGEMGPLYGFQLRKYAGDYLHNHNTGYDQLKDIIHQLKHDPTSRRILMTTFNPKEVQNSVLAPCHGIAIQFYVDDNKLSCHMYQRSGDLFLGVPFNISSYALLTYILAKLCNMQPDRLIMTFGDIHIYETHIEQVKEQISRTIYDFPQLKITKELNNISDIEKLEYIDIELYNYQCHPPIKAAMNI